MNGSGLVDRFLFSIYVTVDLKITLNGEPKELPDGTTIAALLATMKIDRAQVAVEVNANVVRRARHAEHALSEGDAVEIVTFVGGG